MNEQLAAIRARRARISSWVARTKARHAEAYNDAEPAFIAALAERGVTVNRSQVNQFRPVAAARGDCKPHGTGKRCVWEWQASAVDVWMIALNYRSAKIGAKKWHSKRRYSAEDVQAALDEQEAANAAAEARAPTYNGGVLVMKVYGVSTYLRGLDKQMRVIVAAKSQQKAAELIGISVYELRTYGGQTWNEIEIATATAKPGAVFYQPTQRNDAFREYAQQQQEAA